MRIPERDQAELWLQEAGVLNPGPWVAHSRYVAEAARNIATRLPALDPEAAYVLGLLHDIGRRAGVTGMRHGLDGYTLPGRDGMRGRCPDLPDALLSESRCPGNLRRVGLHAGGNWHSWRTTWRGSTYNDYDRLIQLCDSLANASGFCLMEKRMLDVGLRYGINEFSLRKWQATFNIKVDFEQRMGCSVYSLLPGVVENTFGVTTAELLLLP